METKEKKTVSRKLFFVLLALFLLTTAVFVNEIYNTKASGKLLETQRQGLQSQLLNLSDSLDFKKQQLAMLLGRNAELDALVTQKQAEIDFQKKQIRVLLLQGKATDKELLESKKLLAQYEAMLSDLNYQVTFLNSKVDELTLANNQLSTELNAEKSLTANYSSLNASLNKKMQLATLLPVSNLEVKAVKKRSSGKDQKVLRAKNTDALKISFETGENKVLEPGNVSLFVRVINPKGETIAVNDLGSGVLENAENGSTMLYSQKADIDWNQTNKKVTLYWSENLNQPGTYKVELIQNGFVIGKSEVKLLG